MKLLLLFFIISVNLSSKSKYQFSPRKMQEAKGGKYFDPSEPFSSSSELEDKLILVGFGNFLNSTGLIQFDIFIKTCGSFANAPFDSLNFTATFNNESKYEDIKCDLNETDLDENGDVSYNCSKKIIYSGKVQIQSKNDYKFYDEENKTRSTDKVFLSSLANETYKKISTQTGNLEYITFYVDNITLKEKEFTIEGNMTQNTNSSWAYLKLNNKNVGCSVTNKTIKFSPINSLNDHLSLKIASPIATDKRKILFLTKKNVDDLINYKANGLLVELISFGNFKHEDNKNATSQAYVRGSSDCLNITKYINFTVLIGYDTQKLRRQEEGTEKVVVFGELDRREKGINIYNMTLLNTTNKNIYYASPISNIKYLDSNQVQILSQCPFNSLENDKDYKEDEDYFGYKNFTRIEHFIGVNASEFSKSFGLLNNETQNYDIMQKIGNVSTKYSMFEFDFNVDGELDTKNGTKAYLNYPKNQNESLYIRDEISCSLFKIPNSYKLSCKPKKNIYTEKKYIRIIVPEKKSTLRFLSGTTYINKTIISPNDANGTLDIDVFSDYIFKKKSTGLSAGAIVAIVLSCVAVIAAVLATIFFFSRGVNAPGKNIKDVNVDNSTYKVNN